MSTTLLRSLQWLHVDACSVRPGSIRLTRDRSSRRIRDATGLGNYDDVKSHRHRLTLQHGSAPQPLAPPTCLVCPVYPPPFASKNDAWTPFTTFLPSSAPCARTGEPGARSAIVATTNEVQQAIYSVLAIIAWENRAYRSLRSNSWIFMYAHPILYG